MKLFTVIGLILGLCALLQDAAARRMGGGKGMEEVPEQPLRFRRAVMKSFADPPPPPEDAPQRVEDPPEQPFRARRSVKVAGDPEPPNQMDEVPEQKFRIRRQMPDMPEMPEMPGGMPSPPGGK